MPPPPLHSNQADIVAIRQRFDVMRRLSRNEAPLDYATRVRHLKALRSMIVEHESEFAAAISNDFSHRSAEETRLTEIVPSLQNLHGTLKNLKVWMKPERRKVALHALPARNRVIYQPKGVVLIIAPWNYPLLLAIDPVIAALAAGNRVIVKPSELTPSLSKLLKKLLEETLGEDMASVALGEAEMASVLTALPFDHILFTGSTKVGALVMRAAAKNLTPVTLELGGKSPAIVHESYELSRATRRIARGKLLNAGQTCIAPDYLLINENQVDAFIQSFREETARFYPRLLKNPDYTSIVSDGHFNRLKDLVEDAREKGACIHPIDPASEFSNASFHDSNTRKMAPVLITNVSDDMAIMDQEIFGPLLPVVATGSVEEAISYVNARARPLSLYYFDDDKGRIDKVLNKTTSGGVSVNDTILHVAQEDLPFGGIGPSGMGAYHGRDGFLTFSHAKGVFYQSRFSGVPLTDPPYGKTFAKVVNTLLWRFGARGR